MTVGLKRLVTLASGSAVSALALARASAAPAGEAAAQVAASLDPNLVLTGGAVLFGVAAALWAVRLSVASRNATVDWSRRLAEMEAKFEISESILSSHPGLVLVWDDTEQDLEDGWGHPRVLGGPAALASLLAFVPDEMAAFGDPAQSLCHVLGNLPLEGDESRAAAPTLKDKVQSLRAHGVAARAQSRYRMGQPDLSGDGRGHQSRRGRR